MANTPKNIQGSLTNDAQASKLGARSLNSSESNKPRKRSKLNAGAQENQSQGQSLYDFVAKGEADQLAILSSLRQQPQSNPMNLPPTTMFGATTAFNDPKMLQMAAAPSLYGVATDPSAAHLMPTALLPAAPQAAPQYLDGYLQGLQAAAGFSAFPGAASGPHPQIVGQAGLSTGSFLTAPQASVFEGLPSSSLLAAAQQGPFALPATTQAPAPPALPTTNNAQASVPANGIPSQLPTIMGQPEDVSKLSVHQVLLRNQIEVFEATEDDATTHTRGRNKPVLVGQVGIRCRHCKHLPILQRQKGSTYFPNSLTGLYQAAQNMSSVHMQTGVCMEMPADVKSQFAHSMCFSKAHQSGAGRPFWASSGKRLGLVDTEEHGIRFVRTLPKDAKVVEKPLKVYASRASKKSPTSSKSSKE